MKANKGIARRGIANIILAIILLVVFIAVGLVMLGFFQTFGGQASKVPVLTLLAQPVLYQDPNGAWILTMSVRNTGNDTITVEEAIVEGTACAPVAGAPVTLNPGDSQAIDFDCTGLTLPPGTYSVDVVIVTDGGTYPTSALVQG